MCYEHGYELCAMSMAMSYVYVSILSCRCPTLPLGLACRVQGCIFGARHAWTFIFSCGSLIFSH